MLPVLPPAVSCTSPAVRRASPSGHWPRPAAGAGGRLSAYLRIVAASGPCDLSVTSVVSFSLLGTGQARYGQICWLSAGRRRVTPSPSRASCSNRIEADEDTPGRRHCSIRAMSRSRPRIRARGAVAARSRSTSEAHRREGLSRALRFNSLSDEDREDTECRPRPGWQSGARRPLRAALSAVRADRHLPLVEDARGDPREGRPGSWSLGSAERRLPRQSLTRSRSRLHAEREGRSDRP